MAPSGQGPARTPGADSAGRIAADEAHAVSRLDESCQVEKWGEDAEAQARRRRLHADIRAATAFLALARGYTKGR